MFVLENTQKPSLVLARYSLDTRKICIWHNTSSALIYFVVLKIILSYFGHFEFTFDFIQQCYSIIMWIELEKSKFVAYLPYNQLLDLQDKTFLNVGKYRGRYLIFLMWTLSNSGSDYCRNFIARILFLFSPPKQRKRSKGMVMRTGRNE